ncbi:hypothetical protein BB558_005902 [Smittium angustum]|uniref:Uncharacterized protein n=1 Tax=Smittium angustum TaxID=133377 RepID=A0A2U1IZ62_SMIAN|nr:hypothetical protein BB558_005902 [Smittium angustum]
MVGGSNLVKLRKTPVLAKIPEDVYHLIVVGKSFKTLKYIFEKEMPNQEKLKNLLESSLSLQSIEMTELILKYRTFDLLRKWTTMSLLRSAKNLEFIKYILGKYHHGDLDNKTISEYIKPTIEFFCTHAKSNHIDIIKFCIENGTSIVKGSIVAEQAIRSFSFATTKYLLSMISTDKLCVLALVAGMKSKNPEFIKLLIDHGVDVNIKYGAPLYHACSKGFVESVNCLIENGVDVYLNDSISLQKAAKNKYFNIVELILKNSDKTNGFISKNFSKICASGNFDLVSLYTKYKQLSKSSLDDALLKALGRRHSVIAELLLENGADYNIRDGKVLESAINGYLDTVKKLYKDYKADVNIDEGEAYFYSISNGNNEVSDFLVEAGLNAKYIEMGKVIEACREGNLEKEKEIAELKDIDTSLLEDACLEVACKKGDIEMVKLILRLTEK